MNLENNNKPWLHYEGVEDCVPLTGNREGFAKLRESIDRLLESDDDVLLIDEDDLGFGSLEIQVNPETHETPSRLSHIAMFLIVALFGVSLLVGFCHLLGYLIHGLGFLIDWIF